MLEQMGPKVREEAPVLDQIGPKVREEAPMLEQMGPKVREVVEKLELKNMGADCQETVGEQVEIEEEGNIAEALEVKNGAVADSVAAGSLPVEKMDDCSFEEPNTLEDVVLSDANTLEDMTFGEPSMEELELAIEPVETMIWNSEPVSSPLPELSLHGPAVPLPKHVTFEKEKPKFSQVNFDF